MARITVEDCLKKIDSQYDLVLLAKERTAQLNAGDKTLVNVGRITVLISLAIAMWIAPNLGNIGQVFIYIQEYTGVVSPGILAVFLTGIFWKKTTI